MKNQPLWIALLSGGITTIVTAIVTLVYPPNLTIKTHHNYALACTAGITSFFTTFSLGMITAQKLRSSTNRLENYLEGIYEGNYNLRIPIYTNDELKDLSEKFNSMADMICNLLINIKIQEKNSEKDKEKIASQVIKLLDKVDAAAHGQLNLKIKVRCEELGIISYCFNMTIDKFTQLVKKLDYAGQKVDIIGTDSQTTFKNLSLESQYQVEEIASFINTLEVIIDSFYQRAYIAWEAEQVAQEISSYASTSCLEIDQMLNEIMAAHILISEINQKVKRFAEYNYDLNKIQSLIFQINTHSEILLVNTDICASRKTSNEDIVKIAEELQYLANNWELVKKKLEYFKCKIQSLNLTISENNLALAKSQPKKLGEEVKRGLTKIVQKVYKFNNYIDNVASWGENQVNNLQKLTDFLQIIHEKNIAQAQLTKEVYSSLQTLLSIAESLSESVEDFRLEKTE
ncbi:HAMP domain-containing protein [Dapis sp. BLCC M126]|uniref:HAMP domain-containing protein n=1 Tax=Dapis sp. BLCC M126 TaxID=3400189 RepID=UPI003CF425D6